MNSVLCPGEKKHHHKKDEDYGNDGSGNQAYGGGVQDGNQLTRQPTDMKRQAQDQTYGGDQTNLETGGDTGFGVSPFASARLEVGVCAFHYVAPVGWLLTQLPE
jgi:hypothetical protein